MEISTRSKFWDLELGGQVKPRASGTTPDLERSGRNGPSYLLPAVWSDLNFRAVCTGRSRSNCNRPPTRDPT
jgi:hypothetical protein